MATTPRTASTSDARTRQAEKDADLSVAPPHSEGQPRWRPQLGDDELIARGLPASWQEGHRPVYTDESADGPPVLPDTSGWVKRAPGDVIEAGTPYLYAAKHTENFSYNAAADCDRHIYAPGDYWTPPPVPREPWRVISTDRDQPTLARVLFDLGPEGDMVVTDFWHMRGSTLVSGHYGAWSHPHEVVMHVELLVPVERALIDEAARREACMPGGAGDHRGHDHRNALEIARALAALADGAQS